MCQLIKYPEKSLCLQCIKTHNVSKDRRDGVIWTRLIWTRASTKNPTLSKANSEMLLPSSKAESFVFPLK